LHINPTFVLTLYKYTQFANLYIHTSNMYNKSACMICTFSNYTYILHTLTEVLQVCNHVDPETSCKSYNSTETHSLLYSLVIKNWIPCGDAPPLLPPYGPNEPMGMWPMGPCFHGPMWTKGPSLGPGPVPSLWTADLSKNTSWQNLTSFIWKSNQQSMCLNRVGIRSRVGLAQAFCLTLLTPS
jgi:hypothetical protein